MSTIEPSVVTVEDVYKLCMATYDSLYTDYVRMKLVIITYDYTPQLHALLSRMVTIHTDAMSASNHQSSIASRIYALNIYEGQLGDIHRALCALHARYHQARGPYMVLYTHYMDIRTSILTVCEAVPLLYRTNNVTHLGATQFLESIALLQNDAFRANHDTAMLTRTSQALIHGMPACIASAEASRDALRTLLAAEVRAVGSIDGYLEYAATTDADVSVGDHYQRLCTLVEFMVHEDTAGAAGGGAGAAGSSGTLLRPGHRHMGLRY